MEINHLHQACKKDFKIYTKKKNHLKEELEEIKKHADEKSWTLTAKICSLEAKLREVKGMIK